MKTTHNKHLKNIIGAAIVICFMTLSTSCSSLRPKNNTSSGATIVKVLSYNIHHANPPSKPEGQIDIDAICKVIKNVDPDIVALQEVDSNTNRSGNKNQAQEIAKKVGMYFYFAKAIVYGGGSYGLAILSRYPLKETSTISLPEDVHPASEDRIIALATITLPNKQIIRFASTHLDVENEGNRLLQVKRINDLATEEDLPFIIAGYFNSKKEDAPIHHLQKNFDISCTDCGFTIPPDKPNRTIDFIAFYKKYPFHVVSHQVITETYASDHLPVFATYSIN